MDRRGFICWTARASGVLCWVGLAQSLASCGATSSGSVPGDEPAVLRAPASASISVQARRVQWVQDITPSSANAWVYVPDGTTSPTNVLPNHLGPTFEMRRGAPCSVNWTNAVSVAPSSTLLLSDPPIHPPAPGAICGNVALQSPVGLATHLHGARVDSGSDGWPLAPISFASNPYGFPTSRTFAYPNAQRATMLWYHDHAMDQTGPHVHAGLAGLYFIRDEHDDALMSMLGGPERELPLAIQDRVLTADQTGIDYSAGIVESDGGPSRPEFLGTRLFVNGHPAGSRELERRTWRLRVLNGCNARTLGLALCDPDALQAGSGRIWYTDCLRLVGGDGGLISQSIGLGATDALVIAPAQRRDALLDLSALPPSVKRLRLVNVALRYFVDSGPQAPEAIFTTVPASLLVPSSSDFAPEDLTLYGALDAPLSDVMRIEVIAAQADAPSSATSAIDAVLAAAATDDDFEWDGARLGARSDGTLGPNRLVLLMSNTEGYDASATAHGITGWSDVQIFEMNAQGDDWSLPFQLDLTTARAPAAGSPGSTPTSYGIARRTFFASPTNPDITVAKAYPPVHAPTIVARAGTYERWYVANIGNSQPLSRSAGDPDMHPFHVHLVNFVVTRRWQLSDDEAGQFVEVPAAAQGLDLIARQDTVMIPSGQLVELLVHYPAGFSGDYVYHCHLLEHEDKCMMSHFHVDAA